MSVQFIVYVLLGKLLIYLFQKPPYLSKSKVNFIRELFSCDLCLGFWVYSLLAMILKVRLLEDVYLYVPLVSEFITGSIVTFATHLLTIGWREKFSVTII